MFVFKGQGKSSSVVSGEGNLKSRNSYFELSCNHISGIGELKGPYHRGNFVTVL